MERPKDIMRILVTGASGQLGLSIQDIASEFPQLEFIFAASEDLDITHPKAVNQYFQKGNFNYCINCAAYTNVEQAEKNPELAYKVNAEGAKIIAMACRQNHTILIHISTDYVFDGEKGLPYTTNDTPNPINQYGKSKLAGEQSILNLIDRYFIIRTSWLFHKKHGKNFYKTILEKAQAKEELRITNGETGSPTNAANLAKYIIDMITGKNLEYGIHHFTDGKAMSWYDFAHEILVKNDLGSTTSLIMDNTYPTLAKRPKYSVLLPG
tara:strand:+ start:1276 stop:2076 length:801 start_codon:yes stop_codon:yes gene_type:complete